MEKELENVRQQRSNPTRGLQRAKVALLAILVGAVALVCARAFSHAPFTAQEDKPEIRHVALSSNPKSISTAPAFERGIGLGLFASDADYDYGPMLSEIVKHGATHVMLAVAWYQTSVKTHDIAPRESHSPSNANIAKTIRQARAKGLATTLLPIVRLKNRTPSQWRGRIDPEAGPDIWFAAYWRFLGKMASIAAQTKVERLVVGSELLSMERYEARWRQLINQVRGGYGGRLMYSANWDHFEPIQFWDAVDDVGVTGYFELATDETRKTQAELVQAWAKPLESLQKLKKTRKQQVVLTEIGYPSKSSAARYPWDETRSAPTDHGLQARLYAAFCEAFSESNAIDGFYFWNWFGFGGLNDTGYSPRNKPAASIIRQCFKNPAWDSKG